MSVPMLLDRREAADYLQACHGIPITPEQLARLANQGGGPPFRLCGGRRSAAVYSPGDLDAWADVYLGPAVTCIAEHPACAGPHH
jgi:hypothetical protein